MAKTMTNRAARRRRGQAARLLISVALAACCGTDRGSSEPDSGSAAFLGAEAVAILAAPDRIESFRILRPLDRPVDPAKAIAGVERIAGGPLLDPAQAATVRELLFTDGSWLFDLAKGCEPVPGVLLRAWKGGRYADVQLCFECLMLSVTVDTPVDQFPPGNRWEDFDPVKPRLVALVKALFPSDAAIQALR
jgi:hypothetical protein